MSGLEAMRRWTTGLAIGVLSTLSACASDGGDVASREVVNITHSSTEPAGSLSVSDVAWWPDGRHVVLLTQQPSGSRQLYLQDIASAHRTLPTRR